MKNPQMYSKYNSVPKMAAFQLLEEYASRMKWRDNNESVMDMGCGNGDVTSIIKNYVPTKDVKLIGSDINESMVEYAREHYSKENITFRVLDMEGEIPNELKLGFNHVFSSFTVQLLKNQEKAFKNVYDLLTEVGDCLLWFLKDVPFYEMFIKAAQNDKWKSWIIDNNFLSPYYKMEEAEFKITQILEHIGYTNIQVTSKNMTYVLQNGIKLQNMLKGVASNILPSEMIEEFAKDNVSRAKQLGLIDQNCISYENHDKPINFNYQLLVVCATKT